MCRDRGDLNAHYAVIHQQLWLANDICAADTRHIHTFTHMMCAYGTSYSHT